MKRGSVLVSAALGAALTPLNSTMVAVALPALSVEFGAPADRVTLFVVTGYLVATIVSQMPAGTVADRAGYARFDKDNQALVGATLGIELFKNRFFDLDLEARNYFAFGGDRGGHYVLVPALAAGVAF